MNTIDMNSNLDSIKAKAEDIRNLLLTTSTGNWEDILGHFVVLSGEYGSLAREVGNVLENASAFPDQVTGDPNLVPNLLRTKLSPELENKNRNIINKYVSNNSNYYDPGSNKENIPFLKMHIKQFNDKLAKVDTEFDNKIQQISKHKLVKPSASHDTAIIKDILSITMLGSGIKINAQQQQAQQQQQQATLNALQQQRLLNAQQQQALFNATNPQQQQQKQQQPTPVQQQQITPIVINSPSPSQQKQQQQQIYGVSSPPTNTNKASPQNNFVVNSPTQSNYKPSPSPNIAINKQPTQSIAKPIAQAQSQQSIVQMVQQALPNNNNNSNVQFKPTAVINTNTNNNGVGSAPSIQQQIQLQQQYLLAQQQQQANANAQLTPQQQAALHQNQLQQQLLQQQILQQQQLQQQQAAAGGQQFHNFQPNNNNFQANNNFRPNQ